MRKKIVMSISPLNIIDFIEYIDEDFSYPLHFMSRLLNVSGTAFAHLDIYIDGEEEIDVEKSHVIYIDTKYAENGFFRAASFIGDEKNIQHLKYIIPEELLNRLILSFGEETLWQILENAGIKIFYTLPATETYNNFKKINEDIDNYLRQQVEKESES